LWEDWSIGEQVVIARDLRRLLHLAIEMIMTIVMVKVTVRRGDDLGLQARPAQKDWRYGMRRGARLLKAREQFARRT
jgi:hypothetical protein